MRLGILGGAFNPPHIGHLVCAQEAFAQLELGHVLFVPMGEAPHRQIEQDPGAEVRLRLCERAVAGDERFSVSRLEIDRPGRSYTVDTLRELRADPAVEELVLLLGGDRAASLPAWRDPEQILELSRVAVADRTGFERERVETELAGLAGAERIAFFEMPRIDISSTLVRGRAAEGRPLRYLVPDAVADLIGAEGLYRTAVPSG